MKATVVYVFFTRGEGFVSRMIAHVLKCTWTHTGIGFRLSDGSEVYYEALAGRNVVGPRPMTDLVDWQQRKPTRRLIILECPALAPSAELKHQLVELDKDHVTYSELALLGHWFLARFGVPLKDSPNRVVCSEYVSRKLAPTYDARTKDFPTHDSISPAQLYSHLISRNCPIRYAAGGI